MPLPPLRQLLGALLAAAVLVPALPSAAATSEFVDMDDHALNPAYASFYVQEVQFAPASCSAGLRRQNVECATITAPLDWNDPRKGSIELKIGRKVGERPDGKRLLLSNPGGPGSGGIGYGVLAAPEYAGAEATHYAIGIDPRGMGDSTPLRVVPPTPDPRDFRADGDSRTYTREGVQAAIDYDAAMNKALSAHPHAPYVNTVQTARDFNLVRAILGFAQADYFGISYGTTLGSTMAKMFPNKFDRVVLDANTNWNNPTSEPPRANQVPGNQMAVDRILLPFLARHHDRYGLGTTTAEVNANIERIRAHLTDPATKTGIADTVEGFLSTSVRVPHLLDLFGQKLGQARRAIERGATPQECIDLLSNPTEPPRQLAEEPEPEPEPAAIDAGGGAVTCGDGAPELDAWAHFRKYEADIINRPVMGAKRALPLCYGYTAPQGALSDDIVRRPLKQVLMMQQEGDPATSYTGAYDTLKSAQGTVRMVNVDDLPGHGHAAESSECARKPLLAYMVRGEFPKADVSCQADPLSFPKWDLTPDGSDGGFVEDSKSYEAMHPGSPSSLPKPYLYVMRDLSDPREDTSTRPRTSLTTATPTSRVKKFDFLAPDPLGDYPILRRILAERTKGK